jgi:hypothetical protein
MFRIFRISMVVLLVIAVLGIVGCEKLADKVAEETAEALVEGGSGVDVEIDDKGTTVEIDGQ